MRRLLAVFCSCLSAWSPWGCVSPSREGLPADSPFRESVVLAEGLLPQGIAIGDLTQTSALLWLRTDGPALVQVEWAPPSVWDMIRKMATITAPVSRSKRFTTTAEDDFTLTVPLEGLVPGTTYRYHILAKRVDDGDPIEARLAARGDFKTLPDAATGAPVTFAWSGDLGGQQHCRRGEAGYPIFDVMRRRSPDFFIFLGDTIYSDEPCLSPPNEPGAEFTASTLDQYRARHRYQRGAAALRRFLEIVPVYVMWDDHEVRNNFAGPFDERMPIGRRALRDYWPIASPADDPHRLYRSIRYGKHLEVFLLDTRQYRSRNAEPDAPMKTMLGPAQLDWLLHGLIHSTATWKVIASSVPLSIPKSGGVTVPGNDGWAGGEDGTGFERERQVIVDAILRGAVTNVVWLGADVHLVQASAYDPNRDGIADFHEFVAGPLSAATGRLPEQSRTLNPTTLIYEAGYLNFGQVTVTASSFQVEIVDGDGWLRFSHRLPSR